MPKVVIENKEGFYKDLFENEEGKEIESFILGFKEGRNVEKLCRSHDVVPDHYTGYTGMFDLGLAIGGLSAKHGQSFSVGLNLGRKNLQGKVKVV
jgi:hypothetical protein